MYENKASQAESFYGVNSRGVQTHSPIPGALERMLAHIEANLVETMRFSFMQMKTHNRFQEIIINEDDAIEIELLTCDRKQFATMNWEKVFSL